MLGLFNVTIKLKMAGNCLRNIQITKFFPKKYFNQGRGETQVIITCNYRKYFCLEAKRKYFVDHRQGIRRGDVDVIIVS